MRQSTMYCNYCGIGGTMLRWTCHRCPTRYCSLDCTNNDKRDHAQVCGHSRFQDTSSWTSDYYQYQDYQHRHSGGGVSHSSGQNYQHSSNRGYHQSYRNDARNNDSRAKHYNAKVSSYHDDRNVHHQQHQTRVFHNSAFRRNPTKQTEMQNTGASNRKPLNVKRFPEKPTVVENVLKTSDLNLKKAQPPNAPEAKVQQSKENVSVRVPPPKRVQPTRLNASKVHQPKENNPAPVPSQKKVQPTKAPSSKVQQPKESISAFVPPSKKVQPKINSTAQHDSKDFSGIKTKDTKNSNPSPSAEKNLHKQTLNAGKKKAGGNIFDILMQDSSVDNSHDESAVEVEEKEGVKNAKVQPKVLSKAEKKKLKKERQKKRAEDDLQKLDEEIMKFNKFDDCVEAAKKEISRRRYDAAHMLFWEALECNPSPSEKVKLLKERTKLYIAQEKFESSINDCKKVIELEPKNENFHQTFASSCLKLGDFSEWQTHYEKYKTLGFKIIEVTNDKFASLRKSMEKAGESEKKKMYSEALVIVTDCLQMCPHSSKLMLMKAKLLCLDKNYPKALKCFEVLDKMSLKQRVNQHEKSFVKGIYFYNRWEPKQALDNLTVAKIEIKEAEEWFKRTKEMMNALKQIESIGERDCERALKVADKALGLDPSNKKFNFEVYMSKANVLRGEDRDEEAVVSLTKAIEIDEKSSTAFYLRGICHYDLRKYEEAVKDSKMAWNIDKDGAYMSLMKKAEAKLKKMEEKGKEETRSFYDVLEVDRNASMKEIRTAYKSKARAFHPDKHSNASKEVLVEMEGKMKEVASAYSCLSNQQRRDVYDRKLDDDDMSDDDWFDCSDDDDYYGDDSDDDMEFMQFLFFIQNLMGGGDCCHSGPRYFRGRF